MTAAEPQPSQPQRRLWVLWLLFFFQFAGIGVYFTYQNLYYLSAGLTGTQIGLISMMLSLVSFSSAILWGYWSDRTGHARLLIALGAVGALIVAQFVPRVHTFTGFLLLACLSSLLYTAPATLIDSTTLSILGDRRSDYGRYRISGSIGYIVTTPLAGFLFDRVGLLWMFPLYGIVMAAFAASALLLPRATVRLEQKGRSEVGKLIRQPVWLVFILVVFLCWVATNGSIMFMGVALASMGADESLIGLAVTIGAVVELPFMFFSGNLLRRYGPISLLTASMLLMIVRFSLLSWMPTPEWAIAINMLNGPAFVFFWNSAINYANETAPRGLAGTAQGILSATSSLAGVLSSLLAGWLIDRSGPQMLFFVMGCFCVAALLIFTGPRLLAMIQHRTGIGRNI